MKPSFPLTHEEFVHIFSRVPRLCIDIVIRTPQGVLLTLRSKYSYVGKWHLPGGSVHFGESLEDTVRRVCNEELGVGVLSMERIGIIQYLKEERVEGRGHAVGVVYECIPETADFVLDDQASGVRFYQQLPDAIIPEQRAFLEKKGMV